MHDANAGPASSASGLTTKVLALAAIVAVVGATSFVAFGADRAGEVGFWLLAGGPVVALAPAALWWAWRRGEIREWMRPKAGDFSLGFLAAGVLFVGAYAFSKLVTPNGSPRAIWLARLYLQLGDPSALRAHPSALFVGFIVVAAAEEIVWRGLVTSLLGDVLPGKRAADERDEGSDTRPRSGSRLAWVAGAGLYAVAYVPTMWALAAPSGPNPLLPIAALGAGLVWAGMSRAVGRLPPAIIAHALFDWCVVVMFRLWGESL